ncbi:MAG: alpha-L-fucosidase [Bacteroidetes bacterium GWF2_42_66]|nr:MAG: alpha-L-fucosidase [Bacteroidetes bacterium GWA2_42_15]OFY02859.1 MAG: alpha-L-fucosidase [Bacteroidetes bacterium GWE2_42_39]OFY44513.1 MAG: alpha-L-fucosidase [Bacteroidetes bacterium GWF2_42_66]HAZ04640.1 alpha-L-fucosidase [Marinilabiliales bacterium]HBL74941.1 alpha-L-fucosidase [Prolixibacteraceae bacterium]
MKLKKINLLFAFTLVISMTLPAQEKSFTETGAQKKERMAWWTNDRFGMFIHWGIYALPARHEWVKRHERMTNEQYQKYFELFNPDLYNPAGWAKKAKEAGMKYAVITTKHHDGFCLFDSKYTDYKATNTPIGKDLIKEWVEAFRAEGMKVGFYYSLLDWHHPHYIIDRNHPQSASSNEEYEALNKGRDMGIYRQYVKNQLREILTNYGKIDILWLDYSFPSGKHGKGRDDWDSEGLLKIVRELQPGIILNDRLDLLDVNGGWDFTTPEQYKVSKWPERNGVKVPWETCQTFSGSWGYYRDEATWKDIRQLLTLLIETVSKGGNLLLNVGPTARGMFDSRATERLESIGEWMKYNSRAIYNCTEVPEGFTSPENSLMTYNPETNRLYIHLLEYPLQYCTLKGFAGKVKYAQFLHDGSEIKFGEPRHNVTYQEQKADEDLILILPVVKPNVEIPVVELILQESL